MLPTPATAANAPSGPAPHGRPRSRGERLLLALLIAAHLAPLLVLPALPTQDGPSHQALSYALRIWDEPEATPLQRYLERNEEAVPNWFVFLVEAELLRPLSLQAAEKALLAGYVVLLPLALRWALRGVHPDAGFLAVLGVPFTYNYLLNLGFFNFCWSLVAFLVALGWFLRGRDRPPAARAAALALLALWVYFCHGIAFVMLALAVGTLSLAWGWRDARAAGGGWRGVRAALARRLPALLALLPGAALVLAFLGSRMEEGTGAMPLAPRLYHLPAIYSLVSYDRRAVVFSAALAALLAALAWRRLRRPDGAAGDGAQGLLAVAAVFVLVYLVAPNDLAGGGYVTHRLNLFPPLALLLWLAAASYGPRLRAAVQAIGAALALGLLGLLWMRWAAVDDALRDHRLAAARVPAGATALPLSYAHAGRGRDGRPLAFRVQPFLHALGYASARAPIVDLGLYGASEDYFPLRYRPALDPYHHLGRGRHGMEGQPPTVDIRGYERRTGGRVDFVLLWQPAAAPPRHSSVIGLRRQLDEGYERVYVSPRGLAELWRRRRR